MGISALVASALTGLGVGAETAGALAPVLGGALTSGALGAGMSALYGGNIGQGALTGAIMGGINGLSGSQTPNAGIPQSVAVTPGAQGQNFGGVTPGSVFGQYDNVPGGGALFGGGGGGGAQPSGTSKTLSTLMALGQILSRQPAKPNPNDPFNKALNPVGYLNRTAVPSYAPASGSWSTYGETPEPQFFNNNQVTGFAKGGALRADPAGYAVGGGPAGGGPAGAPGSAAGGTTGVGGSNAGDIGLASGGAQSNQGTQSSTSSPSSIWDVGNLFRDALQAGSYAPGMIGTGIGLAREYERGGFPMGGEQAGKLGRWGDVGSYLSIPGLAGHAYRTIQDLINGGGGNNPAPDTSGLTSQTPPTSVIDRLTGSGTPSSGSTPGPITDFHDLTGAYSTPNPVGFAPLPPVSSGGGYPGYGGNQTSGALTAGNPSTAYTPSASDMASLQGSLGNYTYAGQPGSQGALNPFATGSGYNVFGSNNSQANNIGGNFFGTQGLTIGGPNSLPNGGGNGGILARGGSMRDAPQGALSRGRQTLDTSRGDHYVRGGDTGQSDRQPALLSDGEFVMDAGTVSRLGDGNSEAGARRMEEIRKAIARDAGTGRVIQKKVKSPQHYARQAAA